MDEDKSYVLMSDDPELGVIQIGDGEGYTKAHADRLAAEYRAEGFTVWVAHESALKGLEHELT